jgi:hypothetical protein
VTPDRSLRQIALQIFFGATTDFVVLIFFSNQRLQYDVFGKTAFSFEVRVHGRGLFGEGWNRNGYKHEENIEFVHHSITPHCAVTHNPNSRPSDMKIRQVASQQKTVTKLTP